MNQDLLIRSYIYPSLSKYIDKTKLLTEKSTLRNYIEAIDCGFSIRYIDYTGRENTILFRLFPDDHEMIALRSVAAGLYRPLFSRASGRHRFDFNSYHPTKDYPAFRAKILPTVRKVSKQQFFSIMVSEGYGSIDFFDNPEEDMTEISVSTMDACNTWLDGADLKATIWKEHKVMLALFRKLRVDQSRKVKTLDDILMGDN